MSDKPDQKTSLDANNIYYFCDDFTNQTTKPVIEFIIQKNFLSDSEKPDHLQLVINSYGGNVHSCLALVDVIKGSSIPVHTLGLGVIASCGVLLFMSGEKGHRLITPNTAILSHQYSWGSSGKSHELFATVKEFELTQDRLMEHYRKCTNMDDETIKEKLLPAHDVWLSAEEAVQYGIADDIKIVY